MTFRGRAFLSVVLFSCVLPVAALAGDRSPRSAGTSVYLPSSGSFFVDPEALTRVGGVSATGWFNTSLSARHSYEIEVFAESVRNQAGTASLSLTFFGSDGVAAYSGSAINARNPANPTSTNCPSAYGGACYGGSRYTTSLSGSNAVMVIRVDPNLSTDGDGVRYGIRITDTTLKNPWFFISGDYSAFSTITNTTDVTVNGSVYFWAPNGSLINTVPFTLAANGNTAIDARGPVDPLVYSSGSTTIAHDGPWGAIRAMCTTLSGTTGLSFDTSYEPMHGQKLGSSFMTGDVGTGGGGVPSVNGITGAVTVNAAGSVAVGTAGNTITVTGPAALPPAGPAGGSLAGTYPTPSLAAASVTAANIAPAQVVKSLNTLKDDVTLAAGTNVTITPSGQTLTIASGGGFPAGSLIFGAPGDTTLIGAGFTEINPYQEDFWTPTSTASAPSGRTGHVAVWTGTRMIVWGGNSSTYFNDGGVYDPVADSWTATSTAGAPSGRSFHTAVWTGTKMIVWGGNDVSAELNTGGLYDPVGDSWTPTAVTGTTPGPRTQHTAVWTGSTMIVWGGGAQHANVLFNTGGIYNPSSDTWTPTAVTGSTPLPRVAHTAVWTGAKMIVWGGYIGSEANSGGLYDPGTDSWLATSTAGAPSPRQEHTAVWTGARMVVWGGIGTSNLQTGGRYDPATNTWTPTSVGSTTPSPRRSHSAVWTGVKMLIWGGWDGFLPMATGGQYDPVNDYWISSLGGPQVLRHTAVWSGSRMIVWGGFNTTDDGNSGAQWHFLSIYVKN